MMLRSRLHSTTRASAAAALRRAYSIQPMWQPTDLEPLPSYDCVRFEHCVRAMHRIRTGVVRTECRRSHWLSSATGCELCTRVRHSNVHA